MPYKEGHDQRGIQLIVNDYSIPFRIVVNSENNVVLALVLGGQDNLNLILERLNAEV